MSYAHAIPAAQASTEERAAFITRTYAHLFGAILAFVGIEIAVFKLTDLPLRTLEILAQNRFYWLAVLGLFMVVGYAAERMARSASSLAVQYLGLGLYVAVEAALFVPLLAVAVFFVDDPSILPTAAGATLGLFTVLTIVVFLTRTDFSFMRGILMFGGFAAMGIIVAGVLFGFTLGPIFSVAMIALAAGYVLYYTGNVLHHYRTNQHVAAALALFAAIALMFWYVLRLLMQLRR